MNHDPFAYTEPLTDRELEILGLIRDGLSNQEIAERVFLTVGTVKWYNQQIFQKLGVSSRTHALARAQALHLFDALEQVTLQNSIPVQTSVFIGRDAELAAVQSRLRDATCRILTLTGPGGMGKTRLALQVAQHIRTEFTDGVYFVPLAALESPAGIIRTLANTLGIIDTGPKNLLAQVSSALRDQNVLLILDNFEHLLDGVNVLTDLLDKTKQTKLLVTSRERLHLKEEWIIEIHGLDCSIDALSEKAIDLSAYEATHLFLHTAKRTAPDFAPNTAENVLIARICQAVGGMPLAIELAAAWVRVLSCEEILHEVEHDLDILHATWRDVPERHHSIRAVFDHSWKLLSPVGQRAFARLTVFSGSFTRQAAAEVTGASLTALSDLVDKSFLRRPKVSRFALHELLKQFGREKLHENADDWNETCLKHARYYAAYLVDQVGQAQAATQLTEVQAVFDDIQAAWRWAVSNKYRDEIHAFSRSLLNYYNLDGWFRAGYGAVEQYQQARLCFDEEPSEPGTVATLIAIYESLGNLHEYYREYAQALANYQFALHFTPPADAVGCAHFHRKMGVVRMQTHQHPAALEAYDQAEVLLESVQERSSDWWFEQIELQIARLDLYYWDNRLDDLLTLEAQFQSQFEQHSLLIQRPRCFRILAAIALRRDRYFHSLDAITFSGEALTLNQKLGAVNAIAENEFNYGVSLLWDNQFDKAEKHMLIAQEMSQQNGDLTLLARVLTYLTSLYRKVGNIDRVRLYAAESLKIAQEVQMPQYVGAAYGQYAWLAWRAGDVDETLTQAEAAFAEWARFGAEKTVVTFRWFAVFPFIGAAVQQNKIERAIHEGELLLLPAQHRLPDSLTKLLEGAIAAWQQNKQSVTQALLRQLVEEAQASLYL